jgi:hypothetical protein
MLIRALNLLHVIAIPMNPDNTVYEKLVLGTRTSHRVFEQHCVAPCFVGSSAELVEQSRFHMAREFLCLYISICSIE